MTIDRKNLLKRLAITKLPNGTICVITMDEKTLEPVGMNPVFEKGELKEPLFEDLLLSSLILYKCVDVAETVLTEHVELTGHIMRALGYPDDNKFVEALKYLLTLCKEAKIPAENGFDAFVNKMCGIADEDPNPMKRRKELVEAFLRDKKTEGEA